MTRVTVTGFQNMESAIDAATFHETVECLLDDGWPLDKAESFARDVQSRCREDRKGNICKREVKP